MQEFERERPEQLRLFHSDSYPNWWPEHQEFSPPVEQDGQLSLLEPHTLPTFALHHALLIDNPSRNRRRIRIDGHQTPFGQGYLVSLDGSCRLLAAVNDGVDGEPGNWHAETFRMKFPRDEYDNIDLDKAEWQDQIWEETYRNPVDLDGLLALVDQLKFEYGMSPDEAGRSKECNAIPDVISGGASQVIHSIPSEEYEHVADPLSLLELNLESEDMPDLAYDIARHMTETVEKIRVYGGGWHVIYRSRLSNYPLGVNNRDLLDLALIFVPDQSMWFAAGVEQTQEVGKNNIRAFCTYERQVMAEDVPALILEVLSGKVATDRRPVAEIDMDDELFLEDEGTNPYKLLSDSA